MALAAVVVAGTFRPVASPPTIDNRGLLFVFVGESNTGGVALNAHAAHHEVGVRPAVQILNNTSLEFEPLSIGSNNLIGHAQLTGVSDPRDGGTYDQTSHGWELGLANMVAPGNTVWLVKAGQGGSHLDDWRDGGAYMKAFRERLRASRASRLPTETWVFLQIGINDRIAGTSVTAYRDGLRDLVARIRKETGPCVLVMPGFMPQHHEFNDVVHEVCSECRGVFVDTSDVSLADGIDANHWGYRGMKEIITRMVEAARLASANDNKKPLLSSAANEKPVHNAWRLSLRTYSPARQETP